MLSKLVVVERLHMIQDFPQLRGDVLAPQGSVQDLGLQVVLLEQLLQRSLKLLGCRSVDHADQVCLLLGGVRKDLVADVVHRQQHLAVG